MKKLDNLTFHIIYAEIGAFSSRAVHYLAPKLPHIGNNARVTHVIVAQNAKQYRRYSEDEEESSGDGFITGFIADAGVVVVEDDISAGGEDNEVVTDDILAVGDLSSEEKSSYTEETNDSVTERIQSDVKEEDHETRQLSVDSKGTAKEKNTTGEEDLPIWSGSVIDVVLIGFIILVALAIAIPIFYWSYWLVVLYRNFVQTVRK